MKTVHRIITAILISFMALAIAPQVTAQAATVSPGNAALSWAEGHATGLWYSYGTAGPSTYDCSGLVSTAVLKATGKWIGRSTYEMLDTMGHGHFVRILLSEARRGDLLFYGSGHVEFDTMWYHTSFGAHHTGARIGWVRWGSFWAPTMAFRIT